MISEQKSTTDTISKILEALKNSGKNPHIEITGGSGEPYRCKLTMGVDTLKVEGETFLLMNEKFIEAALPRLKQIAEEQYETARLIFEKRSSKSSTAIGRTEIE